MEQFLTDRNLPSTSIIPEEDYELWTLGFVPDSQYLLSARSGDLNAKAQWEDLCSYLLSVQNEKNLQMVLHSGDIINGGSNGAYCAESFNRGATGINTLLNANFPILWSVGCHDYDNDFDATAGRAITNMQSKIPKTKYDTYSWFGASTYPVGTMRNTYAIKTLGGKKWMFLTFEIFPPNGAITWAEGVIASENPDYIVVCTNGYLEYDGSLTQWTSPYGPGNQGTTITEGQANCYTGQELWDNFISQHQQIVLVLCAHTFDDSAATHEPTNPGKIAHAKRTNVHANGNICTQIITNFQEDKVYKKPWVVGTNYIAYSSGAAQELVEVSHPGGDGKTDNWNTYYRCKQSHTASAANKPGEGASWTSYWDSYTWDGCGFCGTIVFFEINPNNRTITRYDYHPVSQISPANNPKGNYPTQLPDWANLHAFTFSY